MLSFTAASEPKEILVETPQYKVFQSVAVDFLCFFRVQMPVLFCYAFGGYPCQKHLWGTFAICGIQTRLGSEPRAQLLKVLQCVCCELIECRIQHCCKVQMLPFTAASEPGDVFVEALQ